jgi:hypothetical protein
VRPSVLLAFNEEPGDAAEDLEPTGGIATDLDLRASRAERVERLVQKVAHHAHLRLVAMRAEVADRQVVVDPHVALDEAGDVVGVLLAVVALQHQQIAARGGAAVALAPTLVVGMSQRGADLGAQGGVVTWLRRAEPIRDGRAFDVGLHGAARRTA